MPLIRLSISTVVLFLSALRIGVQPWRFSRPSGAPTELERRIEPGQALSISRLWIFFSGSLTYKFITAGSLENVTSHVPADDPESRETKRDSERQHTNFRVSLRPPCDLSLDIYSGVTMNRLSSPIRSIFATRSLPTTTTRHFIRPLMMTTEDQFKQVLSFLIRITLSSTFNTCF